MCPLLKAVDHTFNCITEGNYLMFDERVVMRHFINYISLGVRYKKYNRYERYEKY